MTTAQTASSPRPAWTRWRCWALALLAVAFAWTGLVGAWLPNWLKPRVEAAASEALGTPVRIQALHIQPLTWVVGLDGLSVGPAAAPILKVQQVQTQLSLESLWRFAPVLRRVSVVKPELWIERQSAQAFNFSPILARLQNQPKTPDTGGEPARFAVFNIELTDGLVRYTDRVLAQEHRIDQLRIGIPFVSSLPSHTQVHVQPLLAARIDGSPLQIKGKTLLFDEGLRSEVQLNWDAVDVPHWLAAAQPFVPEAWRMQADSGRLDTALTLQFEARRPPAVPRLAIQGGFKLSQLGLTLPTAPGLGRVEAGWETLAVEGVDALPLERQVRVGAVLLDGVRVQVRALRVPAAHQAKAPVAKQAPAPAEVAPTKPWAWRLDKLRVNTNKLDMQTVPDVKPGQAWPAIAAVRLSVDGLDAARAAKPASWQLDVRDEHAASLLAQGHVQVAQQLVDGQLNLSKVSLQPWAQALSGLVNLPVQVRQGELAMRAQLQARLQTASALEPAQARLLSGNVQLSQLGLHASQAASRDRILLDKLSVDGVQAELDLAASPALRMLTVDHVDLHKLDAAVTRSAQGTFFGMSPAGPDQAPVTTATRSAQPQPQITLKALNCSDCQLQLQDQTVSPAGRIEVHQTRLSLADLSNDLSRPVQLTLDTLAQGRGRIQIKGAVTPQPLAVNARVDLTALDLAGVQPYIDPLVNIRLAAGKAQASGQLSLQMPVAGPLQTRYRGRLGINALRVNDRVNEADFLSWQALSLDGVDIALAGQAVDANLGRITLKDFFGRLIINPNGQLNLAGIMRSEAGGETRSLTTPEPKVDVAKPAAPVDPVVPLASAAATASSPAAPAPKLRWQQIQLSKGRVAFTDNFIKPNYSARLTQVEGEVSAVASTKPEPATIKISGAVDDAAPLLVTGQIHPLGPQLYTDIQGSAKGIELTRLTPYAARYAGYGIEKGTLSVTVKYKVDGGKLEASNQIFLDQLTFGEKVNSPDATGLPVLFAVSLLQNRRGEIDVNLPISGSLDDPQFSVGGIIWHVIANLITKAVTAPFALLAGGDAQELGHVAFDAGSASLNDAARQRLDTLADKLMDRPALKLEATGRADPAQDTEGLRRIHVNRLLRLAKSKATGQPMPETRVAPEERLTWLSAAYKAADIKKPRNLIGLAKTLPPEEMESLLMASANVGDEALRTLANQRGDQVKAYLASKMPPERILLTASKVGVAGLPEDKGPSTRVQFEIK